MRPGDDVAAVLSRVGDGSTVTFAPGSYEVNETIVVDVSLELIGSGRDSTTITSTAAGLAVAFVGPGDLLVRDLALRHTGDDAASVLLAIEGAVTLQRLEISGASTSSDRTAAGHGIVFAFEELPNLPQRTAEQRAGVLLVEDVSVTGNEGAGVLVSGDAAPRISASTISGNGTCGVCFVDEASGSVTGTTIEGNGGIGIQIVDSSHPTIEHTTLRTHGIAVLLSDSPVATMTANTLEGNEVGIQAGGTARLDAVDNVIDAAEQAGITFADSSTGSVRGNRITGTTSIGIDVSGAASPSVEGNTIEGAGRAGISFLGTTTGRASLNTIVGRDIGFQVGGSASPEVTANQVRDSQVAGMLFAEQGSGVVNGNTVTGSIATAIQVAGSAHPEISANELRGGEFGLTFLDGAGGVATGNRIVDHRVGVQLAGTASPRLEGNELDAIQEAAIVYAEASAGEAAGNLCLTTTALGIVLAPSATPTMDGNECEVVRSS